MSRVIPALVMERRIRRSAGSRLRRRGGPPAIEIVGLDAVEQAEVLDALYRRYVRFLPVNDPGGLPQAGGRVDSLWYLSTRVCGLGGYVTRRAPIRFPRFLLGLMAYAWGEKDDRPRLEDIADGHEWLERELRRDREGSPRWAARQQLLSDMEGHLAGTGLRGVMAAAGLAIVRFLRGRPRASRVALRWWGTILHAPPAGVFPLQGIVADRLFHQFNVRRRREDGRDPTPEQLLAAAFLADLDAHYGLRRRLNRDRPPLILLPDGGDPASRQLRDDLLRGYTFAFSHVWARRSVTRPVLFSVTAAGAEEALPLGELETVLGRWTRPAEDCTPKDWLLRAAVPGPAGEES